MIDLKDPLNTETDNWICERRARSSKRGDSYVFQAYCVSKRCCAYYTNISTGRLNVNGEPYKATQYRGKTLKYEQRERPKYKEHCPDCNAKIHWRRLNSVSRKIKER